MKIGAKMGTVTESMHMASETDQPVPAVDATHLRQALALVYTWADTGEDDGEEETIMGGDLFSLLDHLERDFGVPSDIAVALFKRSIALAAYCADAHPPSFLFEDGFPGRQLCAAAAQSAVMNVPGSDDGEMGHTFDVEEMRAALLAAGD